MIKRIRKYRKRTKVNERQKQYEDPRWKELKQKILERDGYKCQWKGCKGDCGTLHVHHLKYLRGKPIWAVSPEHLLTVGEKCHSIIHGRKLYKGRNNKPPRSRRG